MNNNRKRAWEEPEAKLTAHVLSVGMGVWATGGGAIRSVDTIAAADTKNDLEAFDFLMSQTMESALYFTNSFALVEKQQRMDCP